MTRATDPSRRFLALALVDLGAPHIDRAWGYLESWAALERAGVPAKFRRPLLARNLVDADTEAMIRTRAWNAGRPMAPLVLCSGVGMGKSFAGAWWLRERHRAGQSIAWLSATGLSRLDLAREQWRQREQRLAAEQPILADELRRCRKIIALVVDDIGASLLTNHLLRELRSLILNRTDDGLPTMVLVNEAKQPNGQQEDGKKWIEDAFGDRLVDRIREGRGELVALKRAKSRRQPSQETDVDEATGRGRAWKAAAHVIELVGCTDRETGRGWSADARRRLTDPIFGGRITSLWNADTFEGELDELRREFDISMESLQARADALEKADSELRASFIGNSIHALLQQRVDEERAGRDARFKAAMSARQILTREDVEPATEVVPDLPPGARALLAAQGVQVKPREASRDFEATHRARHLQVVDRESVDFDPNDERDRLRAGKPATLGYAQTDRGAWWLAWQAFPELHEALTRPRDPDDMVDEAT